jgi:hypothetical protein
MFIILTVYKIGVQLCDAVKVEKYFHNFLVIIDVSILWKSKIKRI